MFEMCECSISVLPCHEIINTWLPGFGDECFNQTPFQVQGQSWKGQEAQGDPWREGLGQDWKERGQSSL